MSRGNPQRLVRCKVRITFQWPLSAPPSSAVLAGFALPPLENNGLFTTEPFLCESSIWALSNRFWREECSRVGLFPLGSYTVVLTEIWYHCTDKRFSQCTNSSLKISPTQPSPCRVPIHASEDRLLFISLEIIEDYFPHGIIDAY